MDWNSVFIYKPLFILYICIYIYIYIRRWRSCWRSAFHCHHLAAAHLYILLSP
jgi:hypothetical protein